MSKSDIEGLIKQIGDVAKLRVLTAEHPERLLYRTLRETAELFVPQDTDQAVDFNKEFITAGAKYAAWILRDHAKDHPERAKECCVEILEFMVLAYKMEVREAFDHLCVWDEFDNPFEAVEPSTNEKTTAEILAQIESEKC